MSDVVWTGSEQLRSLLVPIESVDPHPENARRGNVALIASSLREYGQQKNIVVWKEHLWVVAGNHLRAAALTLGWTHIAATLEPMDEPTANGYLLIDNRTSDVGDYDSTRLLELLKPFALTGKLEVTGYNEAAFTKLSDAVGRDTVAQSETHVAQTVEAKEAITAVLSTDRMADLRRWIAMLRREWSIEDTSDIVYEAIKREASRL